MFKYDITFLEEKLGDFDKEFQYPRTSLIEGSLIYVEKNTKEELDNEIILIKQDESLNPTYIWGYVNETNAIYFTRAFGENKVFIYNPKSMKKTDYVKGKLKVLNNIQLDTVDDLFDQKAVFEYFYKKLWNLRLDLGKEIRDKNGISDNVALMEAQHIIDRIIFTYFICEKELVSIKNHGPVTGKELFSNIFGQLPDTWDYLKKLFFEQFAKANVNELDCGGDVYIKTPYLNGGLFRPKIISGISEENLNIDYEWNNIFEPLNKYTWLIEDEISDLEGEYEGNLTPEIIGHIYEKFVISIEQLDEINLDELNISRTGDIKRGNKKIGAYYTPERITEYISLNTIGPKLFEKLKKPKKTDFNNFLTDSTSEVLREALEILNEITICDPACGSGAFLIKAGEILLDFKTQLLIQLNEEVDRHDLKKDIIINNLFGVDIQEGAVEICKLRLWLWLISSSKHGIVEPLPNIEYNFVTGNSLVGWSNEKLNQTVLVKLDKMVIVLLEALKLHYKNVDIDKIKQKLLTTDVQNYAEAMSLLKNIYSYSSEGEAEQLKIIIESIRNAIYQKVNGVFYYYIKSEGVKISQDEYESLNPFHWNVDFNPIFKKGGFDILIGNPPYVFTRGKNFSKFEKDLFGKLFSNKLKNGLKSRKNQSGKLNLFTLFIERSINLLSNTNYLGFIVPNNLLRTTTYDLARFHILNNAKIEKIVDLSGGVFDNVTAATIVIILVKENSIEHIAKNKVEIITDIKNIEQEKYKQYNVFQKNFLDNVSFAFNIYVTGELFEIFKKVRKESILLSDVAKTIIEGIVTPKGKNDYISTYTKNSLYKKFIEGKDIKVYAIDYKNKYILYDRKKLHRARPEETFNCTEKIVIQRISGGKQVITAAYDDCQFYTFASVNNLLLKDDSQLNLKYILALLNSTLLNAYYNLNFTNKSDLTVNISSTYLEELPIYDADIKKQNDIVGKVDLMIDLNEKLYSELKSFKSGLISEYELDKLSQKLNKYYELPFDVFLNEIKKKSNVSNEDKLKEKFTENVSIISPILQKIEETNKEIDLIIYNLYSLDDLEIKTIKNSLL